MRLLHTADLHLGRSLHRLPLLDAQAAVLDQLVAVARDEQVDAVIIAGDVFDRALPPVEAVRLAGELLRRLAEIAPVLVISGNHDSAARLGFAGELIAAGGVHLRTEPGRCADPLVLEDEHGPVALYGIPYLDPDLARAELGVQERTHDAVVGAAMDRVRADLVARRATTAAPVRSVVAAHAFVVGGEPSASERDIAVGGVQTVARRAFDGVDYVALGHLHRPHQLGAAPVAVPVPEPAAAEIDALADLGGLFALAAEDVRGTTATAAPAAPRAREPLLRYAGSPLPYSFPEVGDKSVSIVDLDADGVADLRTVVLEAPFRLVRARGTLEELLLDPRLDEHEGEDSWLELTLTDPELPARPMERLRRRFARILVLQHEPEGGVDRTRASSAAQRVAGRTDLEILERFVADVRGRAVEEDERPLLQDALEHALRTADRDRDR
ncbi:exonuclease SbcCD subunit D [Patulibacter brassicae]|uniref:Nuclease SbcCD subunit D n=1 Tax=Patulibacter brassicae TaxID=1705717 RepID=A0ABU4VGT0_9ACTN|nr:exonuclease SbcCD subunit D [Patulibacter brassicae]MDX8151003.1 exonuclease SbcCD subunit D [Patulibacter brassicae]